MLCVVLFTTIASINAQQTIAREWNEELLNAIRLDFARPTVHARNLFHTSVAMYDAWALFDPQAETVFLGKNYKGYDFVFNGIATPSNVDEARAEIISYAMYRLLIHRFSNAPNTSVITSALNTKFTALGYDSSFTSLDYSTNSYAALGNYIASEIINFGMQDGSNEQNDYANQHYVATNAPLASTTGF